MKKEKPNFYGSLEHMQEQLRDYFSPPKPKKGHTLVMALNLVLTGWLKVAKSNLTYLADGLLYLAVGLLIVYSGLNGFSYWFLAAGLVAVLLHNVAIAWASVLSSGYGVPVPPERFTTKATDGTGEVFVEQARLQEMILYVGEVEDYLERRGSL